MSSKEEEPLTLASLHSENGSFLQTPLNIRRVYWIRTFKYFYTKSKGIGFGVFNNDFLRLLKSL